ncbi:MAG: hypothetical protein M1826_005227 [Phylliscum demangeonii]|nr:MAG: hypothetical protein M1826_005227 [Phylliscum demangeonii]
MRASHHLLTLALWLAIAGCLPSTSTPAAKPAFRLGTGLVDFLRHWDTDDTLTVSAIVVGSTGLGGRLLQMRGAKEDRDLVLRMGAYYRMELAGLDHWLHKRRRPWAYRCMKTCIASVFENWFAQDPFVRHQEALLSAYVDCQQRGKCKLNRFEELDPITLRPLYPPPVQEERQRDPITLRSLYPPPGQEERQRDAITLRPLYPPPGQEERQREGDGNGNGNVNEFRLMTGPVSHAAHRFAAHAAQTWKAALAQGGRLEKAALMQGGKLQKALEDDGVLQLVRHEG